MNHGLFLAPSRRRLVEFLRHCTMAAAMICGVYGGPLSAATEPLAWDSLADGLDITIWSPGAACAEETSTIILRVDPELFSFAIHQFQADRLPGPIPLMEWQRRLGAPVLFNAGLFLEDFSYMGLLYKNGQALSRRRHAQWQGLFVAEPVEVGMRRARVLDLTFDPFSDEPPVYREVAQALMVLDRTGKLRVRQSGKRAQQTLLGEDTKGYLYVMKTVTAASLFGLGECLHQTLPWLRQIMAMDGGSSSDLAVSHDLLAKSNKAGTASLWRPIVDGTAPAAHIPLPTIISIAPRKAITK